jgi:hypothetical protein
VRELLWGTFGKGGVEHCAGTCPEHQLRWKALTDCDTEHLQAILRTQRHIPYRYTEAIHAILTERGVKPDEFSFEAESEFLFAVSRAMRRIGKGYSNAQNN